MLGGLALAAGAFGHTCIAVDAGFRIDVQHVVIEMKSLNRTDKRAVSIAAVNARFCNDVSHSDPTSLDSK